VFSCTIPPTTAPTCLSVFTGCTSHSGLNIKSPCWRTKLYMGVRRNTWVLWFRLLIYQVVGHYIPPASVACRCLLLESPPSVAGPSRLPVHESGTLCHRRRALFRQRLKSHLFRQSYPDLDIWCFVLSDCFLLTVYPWSSSATKAYWLIDWYQHVLSDDSIIGFVMHST